jgi:hypothetical protein
MEPLRQSREWLVAISLLFVLVLLVLILVVRMITARESPEGFAQAWKEHHEACLQLPEEIFHRDRARAVRGFVRGPDGKPVRGALVQCMKLTSLVQLAQTRPPTSTLWSHLVETATQTDAEGRYEFPHLAEGCRTICASAPGLAPDVQSLILTLDGSGARIDFDLGAPKKLRVRLKDAKNRPQRIHLVPYRWWPELPAHEVAAGQTEVEFTGIGGPFNKGLVVVSDSSSRSRWEPKAAFDLNHSDDIAVSCSTSYLVSSQDVPEAACVPAWRKGTSEATRLFFSMLTPVALFWPMDSSSEAAPAGKARQAGRETSGLHGYGPSAFLPILIESRDGRAWLEWTSEASEFELLGVPAGIYRVRSMSSFGRVSFARGMVVPPSGVADLNSRLGDSIHLDEPLSREVMGIVHWEDGSAGAGAVVYLQDATDFRRFVRRAVANENGFFWIPNVPAASYIAFALPPQEEHAMKSFIFPVVNKNPGEIWLDFSLSHYRLIGRVPGVGSSKRVELVRRDAEGQESIVWTVTATEEGHFEIRNVPHGHYVVRATGNGSGAKETATSIVSLPFVIEHDREVAVRWPQ